MNNAKISILITDASLLGLGAETFCPDVFDVLHVETNALNAIQVCKDKHPRVLITDLVLEGCDGFTLIQQVKLVSPSTKILIVSRLYRETFVRHAYDLGADDFLMRTLVADNLEEYVMTLLFPLTRKMSPNKQRKVDERLSMLLISIGIHANLLGYHYIKSAVKICMVEPTAVNRMTGYLYVRIAEDFNSTGRRVERSVRHAVELAWSNNALLSLNNVVKTPVISSNIKPTNGELIALLTERMLIEFMKHDEF